MEPDIAHRRHGGAPWMERPPFALDQAHRRIIDRISEHGAGQRDLAGGEGTGLPHRHAPRMADGLLARNNAHR